jgi:hypothetical protein
VPGEKRLTVSIVIDREDPGSVIVYRVFNKHERVYHEGVNLQEAVNAYNTLDHSREVYKQTPPMMFRY